MNHAGSATDLSEDIFELNSNTSEPHDSLFLTLAKGTNDRTRDKGCVVGVGTDLERLRDVDF